MAATVLVAALAHGTQTTDQASTSTQSTTRLQAPTTAPGADSGDSGGDLHVGSGGS
jgi:hypothetical protein